MNTPALVILAALALGQEPGYRQVELASSVAMQRHQTKARCTDKDPGVQRQSFHDIDIAKYLKPEDRETVAEYLCNPLPGQSHVPQLLLDTLQRHGIVPAGVDVHSYLEQMHAPLSIQFGQYHTEPASQVSYPVSDGRITILFGYGFGDDAAKRQLDSVSISYVRNSFADGPVTVTSAQAQALAGEKFSDTVQAEGGHVPPNTKDLCQVIDLAYIRPELPTAHEATCATYQLFYRTDCKPADARQMSGVLLRVSLGTFLVPVTKTGQAVADVLYIPAKLVE